MTVGIHLYGSLAFGLCLPPEQADLKALRAEIKKNDNLAFERAIGALGLSPFDPRRRELAISPSAEVEHKIRTTAEKRIGTLFEIKHKKGSIPVVPSGTYIGGPIFWTLAVEPSTPEFAKSRAGTIVPIIRRPRSSTIKTRSMQNVVGLIEHIENSLQLGTAYARGTDDGGDVRSLGPDLLHKRLIGTD